MKPYLHARTSARKYGGVAEDYYDIHTFIDSSKAAVPDMRHRAQMHHALGCFVVEAVFGPVRTNSDGKTYSPRDVAEDHVIEDLGYIPTLVDWLRNMTLQPWMGGARRDRIKAGRTRAGRVDAAEDAVVEELREAKVASIGKRKID